MAAVDHKMKDEHVFDGMHLNNISPDEVIQRIKEGDVQLDDQDVMVISYPKAGNAWFHEIVWLIMNDADVEKANSMVQEKRITFLEFKVPNGPVMLDLIKGMPPPRIFKSHLPYNIMKKVLEGKKTKIVFGLRNIKDSLVSLYHFYRMNEALGNFKGTFEEFFELFKQKKLAFGDYFDMNASYWNDREHLNLYLLKYEELHKDLEGNIRKLADFLEKSLTDEQFAAIVKHVSFKSMRDNDKVNKTYNPYFNGKVSQYMRSGKVGDWQNYFSADQNEYIDKIYNEKVVGTELETDFTI